MGPSWETSKLESVTPPSLKVSAALNATTLPVMFEPAWISSELTPPVNRMAWPSAAPVPPLEPPLIVPALTTLMLAPSIPAPP